MSDQARRFLLLALLVGLLLILGGRQALDWLGSRAGGLGLVRGRTVDLDDLRGLDVVELRTAELEAVVGELTPGRDPWRFGRREPAPVERPKPRPPVKRPPPQPKPKGPAVAQSDEPRPPPVDVTYLGSFGPARRKIAVFDDGDTVYNALIGDVVKEKFQVFQIGFESVDLTFVGFPDEPPKRLAIGG